MQLQLKSLTRNAGRWLILFPIIMSVSCASNRVRTAVTTEIIELDKEVIVSVPSEMTNPIPIPVLPNPVGPEELAVVYVNTVISLEAANQLLSDIAALPSNEK